MSKASRFADAMRTPRPEFHIQQHVTADFHAQVDSEGNLYIPSSGATLEAKNVNGFVRWLEAVFGPEIKARPRG